MLVKGRMKKKKRELQKNTEKKKLQTKNIVKRMLGENETEIVKYYSTVTTVVLEQGSLEFARFYLCF